MGAGGSPPLLNRRFRNGNVAVFPASSSSVSPPGSSSAFSMESMACIISLFKLSKSSSVMPIRCIMSLTCGRPRFFAHFRHRPSLTVLSPSIRVIKTVAIFFLHLEQSVGCIITSVPPYQTGGKCFVIGVFFTEALPRTNAADSFRLSAALFPIWAPARSKGQQSALPAPAPRFRRPERSCR